MLGLSSSLSSGAAALKSIVRSGLQLFYKADRTQAPLGEEQVRNNSFDEISSNLVSNPTFDLGSEAIQNGGFNELGPDLIDNGNFETGADGWFGVSGSDVTYNSELKGIKLTLGASGASKALNVNSNTILGKTYKLTYRVLENNNCTAITVWNGSQYEGSTVLNVEANGEDFVYYLKFIGNNSKLLYFQNNTINSDITLSNIKLEQVDPNDRWTPNTGWAIANNKLNGTSAETENSQTIFASNSSRMLKITYDLVVDSGQVAVYMADKDKIFISQSGSYTDYVTSAHTDIRIDGRDSSLFTGSVTNISVKEVPNWELGDGWSIVDGKASNDGESGSNNLKQDGILTSNKSYQITIEVSDYVSGNVQVSAGGVPRGTMTANGTYTFNQVASGGNFYIVANSFVGSVDNVFVKQLDPNNKWTVQNPDTSAHTVEIREGETYINYDHDGGTQGSTGINQSGIFPNTTSKYKIEVELGEVTGQLKIQTRGVTNSINSSDSNTTKVILLDSSADSQDVIYIVRLSNAVSGSAVVKSVSVREITNSIKDHSKNSNDGILYSGKALNFDGDGDGVQLNTAHDISILGDYTIAFWFKRNNTSNSLSTIYHNSKNVDNRTGVHWNSSNKITFNSYSTATDYQGVNSPVLDKDKWYRVISVAKGGVKTLYINNENNPPSSGSISSYLPSPNEFLGGSAGGTNCDGAVADFQLYDKAWNATDVKYDWENPDKDVFDRVGEVQVLGEELVSNGDFSNGTTLDWSFDNLTADISNNTLKLTSTTATNSRAYYSISTEVGKTYQMSADVKSSALNSISEIGGIGVTDPISFKDGANADSFTTLKFVFTATLETTQIRFLNSKEGIWGGLGSIAEFDNVSVKEIITQASHILPTDCKSLLRLNEGAGDRVYDAAPVLRDEEVQNGAFNLGTEGIVDRDFPLPNVNWSFQNSAWSINNNKALYDGTLTSYISQSGLTISSDKTYQVSFDIEDSSGQSRIQISNKATNETYSPYTDRANGSYVVTFTPSSNQTTLAFKGHTSGGSFSLSNVSLKEVPNWIVQNSAWSINNNKALYDNSAISYISQSGLTITAGKTYQVSFDIKDSSGQSRIQISNQAASPSGIYSPYTYRPNGSYVFTFTSASNQTTLAFKGHTDGTSFSLSNISLKEIKPAESFAIVGNKAFIHQQPYIPQYAMSSFSKKMVFDGSNDYVNCGSDASIDNIFTGGGTFSAWISPKTDGGENLGTIIAKGSVSIRVKDDDNDGVILNLAKGFSTTNADFLTSDEVVLENKMNHIAVTYNDSSASNTPSFYVNGVLTAIDTGNSTTPVGSASTDAPSNLIIGNATAGGTRSFDGIIDEVSMFKTVLTQDEVLELYNSGSSFDSTGHSKYNLGEEVSNGAFELGSEEITNGDFSDGTTGWQGSDSAADISISNNKIRVTNGDGSAAGFTSISGVPTLSVVSGKTYEIKYESFQGTSSNAKSKLFLGTAFNVGDVLAGIEFQTNGIHSYAFTATATQDLYLLIKNKTVVSGEYMEFDNVSVKEIPSWELRPGWSVNNNTVVYDGTGSQYARIIQTLNTHVGRTYQMTFTLSGLSSGKTVNFGLGRNGAFIYQQQTYSSNGTYTRIMQAQSIDDDIMVQINQADANCTVSNISVQEYGVSGYWRNNGADQWDDLSINSNHGTVSGSPTEIFLQEVPFFGKDSLGMFMNKPRLGGLNLNTSGYVGIEDNNDLDFGTGAFTMECWVVANFTAQGSEEVNVILSLGGNVAVSGTAGLGIKGSTGKIRGYVASEVCDMNDTFTTGQWYHVVTTRAENGLCTLYLDAVAQTDTETTTGNVSNSHSKFIGKDTNAERFYDGVVDDVKLYNRALTPAEIKKNYNATKGKHKN